MQLFNSHTQTHRTSLVVTAQLQQAIQLLHMSNGELSNFIEQQAEENPFLELRLPRTAPSATAAGDDDWDRMANLADSDGPSLYAHASAEIARLDLSVAERRLANYFLDALEPSGWLGGTLAAIAAQAGVSESETEALLPKLQKVDPAGLFARDLAECLRLQVIERGEMTPIFASVLDNLPMLAAADLKGLARVCKCSPDDLRAVLRQVRGLNPKPGTLFDGATEPQRAPELMVTRGAAGWQVDLNRSTLPSVGIRATSAKEIAQRHRPDSPYITERLSVARWLARAVEHRNATTLKVGAEILRRQMEFLDHGPSHLRPMVLRDVSEAIGVHESTVSRVTTGIMMQTPHGTFPLKWFFTAALSRNDGDENGSAAAVRHRIGQLVQAENPADPLSDEAITKIMADEGVELARRTVAKYRDLLHIPSSTQRRRQALVAGRA
jgi:RNA polymerase sigma-54 factor